MTVVNPKSISGINSITTGSGSDNLLTIHTSDASSTERVRINSSGDVIVGSGITVSPDGDIFATGVTTSTTFVGALTGNVTGNISGGTVAGSTGTFSGAVSGTTAAFTGNLSITNTAPQISLVDSDNNSDFSIYGAAGVFNIYDETNSASRLTIASDGTVSILQGLELSSTLTIPDKIIHSGDTNTEISFPSADTIDLQTAGSSRIRLTSDGKVGFHATSPNTRFQVGNATFNGGHGMYSNDRVGMANHGSLTGLMLASTYNDAGVPEYGIVFVQGPDTSNYNCWSISPDGPAKGNSLSLHYGAQNTNIHILSNRKFEFDGDGDFRLTAGNVDVANGYGIDFSATSDYTGAGSGTPSELFDDYEEGTFTPRFQTSNGNWSGSMSTQDGSYTKIGNVVHVRIRLHWGSVGGSGMFRITALPFTVANTGSNEGGGVTIGPRSGFNYSQITSFFRLNTQLLQFQYIASSAPYGSFDVSVGALATSGHAYVSGWYEAA